MKKIFFIGIALAISSLGYAQKVEFEESQTHIIEPMMDALIRPMVAELKMLSTELKVYMPSHQIKDKKISEMTVEDFIVAKANATFHAAIADGADVIIGATYYVRNHVDNKGKPTDYGVDVIVRGYPAKYVNWHQLSDSKYDDEKWINSLIDAQKARAEKGDDAAKALLMLGAGSYSSKK
ncbi:MAG: hypothetical protein IJV44_00170 [Prevotella sp.]|nr:hypothetical protein [Prevotella sp.]